MNETRSVIFGIVYLVRAAGFTIWTIIREVKWRQAGKQGQGIPQAPWIRGGERNKKGIARHPGARFWGQPKKEKKFVHPANAKKARHNRTNYQGRREPDAGQK